MIYTAAVDFTLNMLVEGFGAETKGILLLPPRWVIVIFISTDVLSGRYSNLQEDLQEGHWLTSL